MNKGLKILSALGIGVLGLSMMFLLMAGMSEWKEETYEFENVDFEWDDEGDRYDIYIDELEQHHFYIPTSKATLIWLPGDETLNFVVIEKYKTFFWQETHYHLTKFYLNIGWVEEE